MSDTDRGQVSARAAEVYDAFFVPALFGQWTDIVLDVADVRPAHRTLAEEWAYARLWTSDARRACTLDRWLHRYNNHRHHTAIGGPPASRVTNLARQNS